jgi:acetolactate synthase-1/2/3 large subunit
MENSQHMNGTVVAEFAAALENLGVRHAFGVSGGAISFFWSALGGSGIDVTHFRHESGAAFAACEASVASRAPVIVFVTTGPGLTNVLTGVYAARHEPAHVILVSAYTDGAMHGRQPIQETGPRTIPHDGIYSAGPLFDYATVVTSAAQLPCVVAALAEGVTRPAGFVAHISLSVSVQRQPAAVGPAPGFSPARLARPAAPAREPADQAADVHQLVRDHSWLMWVGGGARASAGSVRRLARAAGVPVMATPRGKGVIAETDPSYLGVTGFAGHSSALAYLERSRPEYILVLGTGMGDFASGYLPGYLPTSAFVHVDVEPSVHGQAFPAATTVPVVAEVGAFCEALAELYEGEPGRRAHPGLGASPFDYEALPADGELIDPGQVMDAVQSVFVDSGVPVLAETGNTLAWAINRLRFSDPSGWRAPSGLVGSMGHFSTGVVGAALASPGPVAALVGDGAMLMSNEVSTAVHRRARAIWVVLNDSSYNMCAQGSAVLGLTDVDCSLPDTDFAGLAQALGATGISVRRAGDLTPALKSALVADGPVVLDVRIDPRHLAPTKGRNAGLLRDSTSHATGSPQRMTIAP